jgi:hypothetical protein
MQRKVTDVLTVLLTGLAGSKLPNASAAVAELNLQLLLETTVALTETILVSAAKIGWIITVFRMSAKTKIMRYLFI